MRCLLLFVGLIIYGASFSQQPSTAFENLNSRNGLSHNSVLSIFQDRKGFMWFGTYGGLNKYDGYKISVYKTEYNDKNSLPTNAIVAITEDRDGNLWLGTYGGGYILYDPATGKFTHNKYLHLNPAGNTIANIRSFYEDKQGNMWVATSEGLDKVEKGTGKINVFRTSSDIHADNNVVVIRSASDNKLWLGTYFGLKLFDMTKGSFEKKYYADINNPEGLTDDHILSMLVDETGIVWLGTEGGGLNRFDPSTGKFRHFKNNPLDPGSISNNIVYDIQQFESDKIMVATEMGINILDLKTEKFEHIVHDARTPGSLSNNSVRSIYLDKSKIMWVGTDGGGVDKMDSQKKKFNLFQRDISNPNSLSNNNVFAIEQDIRQNIWMGTIEGGLDRYDLTTKHFDHFTPDPKNPRSVSSYKILSLHAGPVSGNLWIGTDRDGLCMLPKEQLDASPSQAKFHRYVRGATPNTLNSSVVYSVVEDHNGVVWAGTWSRGVNKMVFDKKNKDGSIDYDHPTITAFRNNPADPKSLSNDVIFSMMEDRSGNLWLATVGGGLEKHEMEERIIDGEKVMVDVFRHYVHDPENPASLSNNGIGAIYESKAGEFWVGTSIGLNKMDRGKGTFKVYTTKDGLSDNVVFGITEDGEGNLWIGTLGGMSKFDPRTETFKKYTYDDGIQDNMFNPHAFCVSKSGEMFFGGPAGVTSFFPDSIHDNPFVPEIMITDFRVFNKSISVGKDIDGHERLTNTIATANDIFLSYKDYVFSIEFSASSYAIPQKNRFAYKMEGFDPEWVYTDASNRVATYTNLNPGDYVFQVKASNCDGVWNDTGTAIRIHIAPPFTKTLWFQLLIAIAAAGLLFIVYRIRVSIIQNQKHALEVQVRERTREIMAQKEEIESQKENIEEKNIILEKQYEEITLKNQQITTQNLSIEEARREIDEKNKKLSDYATALEQNVKERTEQLRSTLVSLNETNKELDQFIYRSAHDLKGPLASITGLCYLGRMETKDPKVVDLLKRLESTTEGMMDKLSRLMKIHEFNTLELTMTTIDYESLLLEIINEVNSVHSCEEITITINVEKNQSHVSDRTLLKILLKNIIENAVKYQDPDKKDRFIRVNVGWRKGATIISIVDNGIGIPLNQADRVFDLFVVATENIKGFGMGLYESKLIARRLRGTVKLQFPASGDTEFVITL